MLAEKVIKTLDELSREIVAEVEPMLVLIYSFSPWHFLRSLQYLNLACCCLPLPSDNSPGTFMEQKKRSKYSRECFKNWNSC